MRKRIFIVLVLISGTIFSQNKHERIHALKVAYFTNKLDLTANEAEKFWPIYNNFQKKLHTLRKESRKKIRTYKKDNFNTISEKDAKQLMLFINKNKEAKFNLINNFNNSISKFLSYKKMLKLEVAEHDFNRKLLRKLQHKKKRKKDAF